MFVVFPVKWNEMKWNDHVLVVMLTDGNLQVTCTLGFVE